MKHSEIPGWAPANVVSFLQEAHTGTVLMANSSGIYLQLDSRILLLCDRRWGQIPIGINLDSFAEVGRKLGLRPGDTVSSGDGVLCFSSEWISATASRVTEHPPAAVCPQCWQEAVPVLCRRTTGLSPLAPWLLLDDAARKDWNPWCIQAGQRLKKLCQGIQTGDAEQIHCAVADLLGLGPGLTPSADDVLCGMLYVTARSPLARHPGSQLLRDAVCREAGCRTHPVSAAYLKVIAQGAPCQRIENSWLSLTNRGAACYDELLEVGSSSGADILLGLLLAGKLQLTMEGWENG